MRCVKPWRPAGGALDRPSPFLYGTVLMKPLLHTGIALLYVWVSVGMTVATHYCGGEPVSAAVLEGAATDASCCCGEQEPMEGCCNTSITMLRLGDAHTAVSEGVTISTFSEQVAIQADQLPPEVPQTLAARLEWPPGTGGPTHILHCVLLI